MRWTYKSAFFIGKPCLDRFLPIRANVGIPSGRITALWIVEGKDSVFAREAAGAGSGNYVIYVPGIFPIRGMGTCLNKRKRDVRFPSTPADYLRFP
jgi:hypothetical protein